MKSYVSYLTGMLSFAVIFSSCNKNSTNLPAPNTRAKMLNATGLTISSFSPASSLAYGAVTINGTGFDTDTAKDIVKINGVTAIVNAATSNKLVVTIPGGASTGNITVSTSGGSATTASAFKVLHLVKVVSASSKMGSVQLIKIVAGLNGVIYGVANINGNNNTRCIVKISNGKASVFYTPPSVYHIASVAVDAKGNVYTGLDTAGYHAYIAKITNGTASLVFPRTVDVFSVEDLAIDTGGNFYVNTGVENISRVSAAGVKTIAFPGDIPGPVTTDHLGNAFGLAGNALQEEQPNENIVYLGVTVIYYMACDANSNLFFYTGKMQVRNFGGYISAINLTSSESPYANGVSSLAFDDQGHLYTLSGTTVNEFALE